jgi:hypothetical protein
MREIANASPDRLGASILSVPTLTPTQSISEQDGRVAARSTLWQRSSWRSQLAQGTKSSTLNPRSPLGSTPEPWRSSTKWRASADFWWILTDRYIVAFRTGPRLNPVLSSLSAWPMSTSLSSLSAWPMSKWPMSKCQFKRQGASQLGDRRAQE